MRPSSRLSEAHEDEIHGIDALEIPLEAHPSRGTRMWRATWPVVVAVTMFIGLWQALVWLEVRPSYALPGPVPVFQRIAEEFRDGRFITALQVTLTRAAVGYAAAFVIGTFVGLAVGGSKILRTATGSLITGLQTMPSISWFPLAILMFQITESAILFVVILGAAPAIANGLITAIDQIPPTLTNAGRVLGAKGWKRYRYVIIPAALPNFVGGMKQGWAFAWRSLMAGEIIVAIANRLGLGTLQKNYLDVNDAVGLLATILVILAVGIAIDRLAFARLERSVFRRWGLGEAT
jgi:NitT/TauT family transport system permease protein